MSDKDHNDWWDDRVEAYVDGLLTDTESAEIESLLNQDSMLTAEVEMAERIRSEFRSMGAIQCPPAVTRDIKRVVRREARQQNVARWVDSVRSAVGGYRKFALAGLILVAILVVLSKNSALAPVNSTQTASVEQALDDVKWTLAMLSDVGADAAGAVRSDVVEPVLIDRLGGTLDLLAETKN
jgi:anti-sigma factor RsiW